MTNYLTDKARTGWILPKPLLYQSICPGFYKRVIKDFAADFSLPATCLNRLGLARVYYVFRHLVL